jgi:hypothetical protein
MGAPGSLHAAALCPNEEDKLICKKPTGHWRFLWKIQNNTLLYYLVVQTCSENIMKMDRDLPVNIRRSSSFI